VGGLKLPNPFQKTVKRQLSSRKQGVVRGLGNASSHLKAIRDFVNSEPASGSLMHEEHGAANPSEQDVC
jgi:hypothetical protein